MMNTNTIKIEKVINGGFGLGRAENGQIILIRCSLPGEIIQYNIVDKKKNFLQGKISKIISPHPERREAPCNYYGKCGGCDLQHCTYSEQLRIKDNIIHDLLVRQGFTTTSFTLRPCLASPEKTSYRQRIRLNIDENGLPGFLHFRSNTNIAIDQCLIAEPTLNIVLQELQVHSTFSQLTSHCKELELLYNPQNKGVVALFHLSRKPRPRDIHSATQLMEGVNLLENIFFKGEDYPLCGTSSDITPQEKLLSSSLILPEITEPFSLTWEVGGFCQVNLKQNNHLVRIVLEMCKAEKTDSVLDLFCGMGNFSIPLARVAHSILGVEGQGSAIRCAKANSSLAGLSNTSFKKSPIHTFCNQLMAGKKVFDLVVIDPPRQGIPGLAQILTKMTKKRLIYISCDPATLCRDLSELNKHGLVLKTIQPVDMFPQTHHIETVALLEKN